MTTVGRPVDRRAEIVELERLADLLDTRWQVPGLGWGVGVDGLAGLVPGLGDLVTGTVSAYLVHRAHRLGVPRHVLLRMAGNVGIDVVFGSVPVIGSIFDFAFKANRRNIALLRRHLEREQRRA